MLVCSCCSCLPAAASHPFATSECDPKMKRERGRRRRADTVRRTAARTRTSLEMNDITRRRIVRGVVNKRRRRGGPWLEEGREFASTLRLLGLRRRVGFFRCPTSLPGQSVRRSITFYSTRQHAMPPPPPPLAPDHAGRHAGLDLIRRRAPRRSAKPRGPGPGRRCPDRAPPPRLYRLRSSATGPQ